MQTVGPSAIEKKILIVEDEVIFAKAIKKHLQQAGFSIELAHNLATAYASLSNTPDLILLDMRLPDGSGLEFLTALRNKENESAVLVMSAYSDLEDVVSAMKLGASDYLKKPIDLRELSININKALDQDVLSRRLEYSAKREQHATEEVKFLGDCSAIQAIRVMITRISQLVPSAEVAAPTVLILGETGTGKDVVARLIHAQSSRANRPFVHVDCASLPKDLIESELFGHAKGAFTDAHTSRAGLIEAAEDGVLFLDEIGELSLDLQAKLLAVLERRVLRRIGTTQEQAVATWIIAATNRNIKQLVEEGMFRADLYYRLNVLSITLPALRERGDDILLLAQYFAEQTVKRYKLKPVHLSKQAAQLLRDCAWRGNVRELKHIIERSVLLNNGGTINGDVLALERVPALKDTGQPMPAQMKLAESEVSMIKQALEKTGYNVSRAAHELGVTRMALRYRIKKYNLSKKKG